MTTIVTRAGKGSPLTHTEVDTNFTNLNTNKLETAAIPLGTAAAPSISFLSDADSGLFSPGANQVAVATNGTQRLTVDSGGITSANGGVFKGDITTYSVDGIALSFVSNVSQIRACRSGGNYGSLAFFTPGANSGGAQAERVRITSEGLLGIGTSVPGAPVNIVSNHSSGALTTSLKLATVGGYAPYSGTSLDFGVDQGNYSTWLTARIGAPRTGDNYGGSLVFYTNRNTSETDIQEAARIDSIGRLLVGTATDLASGSHLFQVNNATTGIVVKNGTAANDNYTCWNAVSSGDNTFIKFYTETSITNRGGITYNRAGGLVVYATTSDYRAKDISGPVQNPGAIIDALKVYEGKMKGATQSRPMLIAHEAQEHAPYIVTGEKDAVKEDGTPELQQMDVSALVPLLLAEIQSLRQRVATLESA